METKKYKEGANKELLPFREGLFEVEENGKGRLLANRCNRCGITFFPKRDFCIQCFKDDTIKDVRLSRKGKLHTFSVVYRNTPDFSTPYIIGYVDLKEDGVRIFAPLTDCDPENLHIGMDMELTIGTRNKKASDEDDKRLLTYKFRPVK